MRGRHGAHEGSHGTGTQGHCHACNGRGDAQTGVHAAGQDNDWNEQRSSMTGELEGQEVDRGLRREKIGEGVGRSEIHRQGEKTRVNGTRTRKEKENKIHTCRSIL